MGFTVETDCETVAALAAALAEHGDFDAFDEIDPRTDGSLMPLVRANLHGCCAGCAVPVGLFKAMQVAAGLALPKDIEIAPVARPRRAVTQSGCSVLNSTPSATCGTTKGHP